MSYLYRLAAAMMVLLATWASDARGQHLHEIDGIELRGEAQLVQSGAGTCNVRETDTGYEEKRANHGAPMDVWRLDFRVRNGSGRWLDHLIARFQIEAEWPECTNWDVPDAPRLAIQYPSASIEWGGSIGHIQESGRHVVSPGQTLTDTKLLIVLRGDPEPRFSNWSIDFDFAASSTPAGSGSPAVPTSRSAAQRLPPTMMRDDEKIYWQSIVDSENPADYDAYLAHFPNGVFRVLAANRLAALREPPDGTSSEGSQPDIQKGADPQLDDDAANRQPTMPYAPFTGAFGFDPKIIQFGTHVFFSSAPEAGEIDLYPNGRLAASLQLAGGDIVHYVWNGKLRYGFNAGIGTAIHADAATVILSMSMFLQIREHSRIEFGRSYGRSANPILDSTQRDKSAWFVGISFPTKINDLFAQ